MQAAKLPISVFNNPIYWAEFHYQRYAIENGRSGRIWIFLAMLMVIPAMLFSLLYIVLVFVNPFHSIAQEAVAFGGGIGTVLITVMTIAMYFVVTLITFGLSTNSIQREKRNHTWDNLRLTNVDGGQIVRGKWWASLRALLGDHVMVSLIRIGFAAVLLIGAGPQMPPQFGLPAEIVWMPLMIVITLLYSVLDAALSAALGIVAAVPEAGEQLVVSVVTAVRIGVMILALVWMTFTFTAMIVGGIALVLVITLLGSAVYGLFIYGALRAAQWLVG